MAGDRKRTSVPRLPVRSLDKYDLQAMSEGNALSAQGRNSRPAIPIKFEGQRAKFGCAKGGAKKRTTLVG
jgi:hypothetical protein